jgi:hypothetical protein
MRTTLDIDDAILAAVKEIAGATDSSAGAVLSELARKGLSANSAQSSATRTGFPVFSVPSDATPLSSAAVKVILSDEGLSPRR